MSSNAAAYKSGQADLAQLKKKQNPAEFQKSLLAFKQTVLTLPFIFTTPTSTNERTECVRHRLLAMHGYEIAVEFFATANEDLDKELFNHLSLLKPFYFDKMLKNENSKNKKRLEILCLDLLTSLVNQRFRDYYCLFERLTAQERSTDTVRFVSQIEESLMEGNYTSLLKVSAMKSMKGFSKIFQKTVEKLEGTVQNEVAQCVEKAYTQISQKDALAMLKNDGKKQKATLPDNWKVVKGVISFQSDADALNKQPKITQEMSEQVIQETVGYAKELEKIV